MVKPGPGKKLTVTVNEADRRHGKAVYIALVELFKHKGLVGATVSRGIAGFTGRGPIQTMSIADLAVDLPVRIEVVDTAEAIERVLPDVYDIADRGLVEVQDTQIVRFSTDDDRRVLPPSPRGELTRLEGKAKQLSVHVGADDKWEGEPLHEAIVKRARQLDIAGATVYRGVLGYGAHGRIHKHRPFALSQDEPVMVAVIDSEEKIDTLLAAIDGMVSGGCLIVVSDVSVIRYEHHGAATDMAAARRDPQEGP